MHIKKFEPHVFSIGKEEFNTLSICVSHLNYMNFSDKTDDYKSYRKHHHQYLPYVQIRSIRYKIEESKSQSQITLIEPEIRWLCRALKELAELSLDDTENSLDDNTENGTWVLDYAEVELNILTEFNRVIDEPEPENLWNRFNKLNHAE